MRRLYGYNRNGIRSLLVRVDIVDGFTNGGDLLCSLIRDLGAELVFKSHDQFHEIERVRFKVLAEASFHGHLALIRTEQIHNDLFNFAECCVSHEIILRKNSFLDLPIVTDRSPKFKHRNTALCQKIRKSKTENSTTLK